ncbi:metal-dependent hydrolase family protein [Demequina zhanjiangensis]|uniref:Amidohydrolase family protein n=1 Tax=Demequina zhanjiangensis TaxID=3051659 RepID=A0ABT8G305_9MICO|nr:amidohydrolase family protein [Demequina sp. SYSU T00b26]MDN4473530.1 amidohydrolase family protein [Demequina sp. SYSU T00b26]
MSTTQRTLTGIGLWDGTTDRGTSTVTWDGDRIVSVEPAAQGAESELSLIPGMIDTHVHLDSNAGSGHADWGTWPLITPASEKSLHVVAHAANAARAGITTLRDLAGSEVQLAASRGLDDHLVPGPRLRVHGTVGMTAGHGDLFTPPHYPHRPPVADSPDECRKLVRQWARQGAHGIKIHVSGGVLSQGDGVGWRNQTDAEIATTVDEAHALGMIVAAHAHSVEGVDRALAHGVDSIEHGTGILPRHWDELIERNIPIAPTLLINDRIAAREIPVTDEAAEKAKGVVAERDDRFRGAAEAGVRFVLGTDANGVMVRFGDQHEELRHMQSLFGWTAERTLVSATSDAADAIGMPDLGRVTSGSRADMLVVRGRPWESLEDLTADSIVAVIVRGELLFGALPE